MDNGNRNKERGFVLPFIWNLLIKTEIPESKNRITVQPTGREAQFDNQPNNFIDENPS
jgi:hypothetical protein